MICSSALTNFFLFSSFDVDSNFKSVKPTEGSMKSQASLLPSSLRFIEQISKSSSTFFLQTLSLPRSSINPGETDHCTFEVSHLNHSSFLWKFHFLAT